MAKIEPEVKQTLEQLTLMRDTLVPTRFDVPQSSAPPSAPAPASSTPDPAKKD